MPIDACLFDMDGLLLDTESIYSQVTFLIVARYGKTYTWETKAKLMGLQKLPAARLLIKELQLEGLLTPEDYLTERDDMQNKLFPNARPLPGVMDLVKHLHAQKVPIAVATSSNRDAFEIKSSNNQELFKLFKVILTGDDVVNGKPAPDIYLKAAKALGVDPSNCLVFEDAPMGVQAGLAADMKVVWIPDSHLAQQEFLGQPGVQILSSMVDFDPAHYGLPSLEK